MRARTINELNQVLVKQKPEFVRGVLHAANVINDMYAASSPHKYAIGDCLLAKLNILGRRQRVRKNPSLLRARRVR